MTLNFCIPIGTDYELFHSYLIEDEKFKNLKKIIFIVPLDTCLRFNGKKMRGINELTCSVYVEIKTSNPRSYYSVSK